MWTRAADRHRVALDFAGDGDRATDADGVARGVFRADRDRSAEGDPIVAIRLDPDMADPGDRRERRNAGRRRQRRHAALFLDPGRRCVVAQSERGTPLVGVERRQLRDELTVLAQESAQLVGRERLAVDRGLFLAVLELDRPDRRVAVDRPQANRLVLHPDPEAFVNPVAQTSRRSGRVSGGREAGEPGQQQGEQREPSRESGEPGSRRLFRPAAESSERERDVASMGRTPFR